MYHVTQLRSQLQITPTQQPQISSKSWHINKVSRAKKDYILVGMEVTMWGLGFLVSTFETEQLSTELSYQKQAIYYLFSLTSTSCSI